MWACGTDFQFQNAERWYHNLDKLIHYVNLNGSVNAFYSTPSIYTDWKKKWNGSYQDSRATCETLSSLQFSTHTPESSPLSRSPVPVASCMSPYTRHTIVPPFTMQVRTDDIFPLADNPHNYWSGYFTSRPALKRQVPTPNSSQRTIPMRLTRVRVAVDRAPRLPRLPPIPPIPHQPHLPPIPALHPIPPHRAPLPLSPCFTGSFCDKHTKCSTSARSGHQHDRVRGGAAHFEEVTTRRQLLDGLARRDGWRGDSP